MIKLKVNVMKILIIEDEMELCKSIVTYLKSEQHVCDIASDYKSAISKVETFEYDCILLDISLPDGNGLDVLKELKANKQSDGVIIISARNAVEDKITGLNLGADDYLQKPFHLSELNARISSLVRRLKFGGNKLITINELTIDLVKKSIAVNGEPIDLTKTEYAIFLYLLANKNKVISKNAIAEHIFEDEADVSENFDFLYTHIRNLKKKLTEAGCRDYIKAVYAMGYKFENTHETST